MQPVESPRGPFADLRWVVEVALARGAPLLTAGERRIARRVLALEGDAAHLYARLTARRPTVFCVEELGDAAAVDTLERAGLCNGFVPWSVRATVLPMRLLKPALAELGLRRSGKREELVARLQAHTHWSALRFTRLCHPGLIRRLERWAFLHRHPERGMLVAERIGQVRYPRYPLSPGVGLHRDRRALRGWEALWRTRDSLSPEAQLEALDAGRHRAPARLDLGRPLREAILEAARALERSGDTERARALYRGLVAGGHVQAPRVAIRVARTLEKDGVPEKALAHLRDVRQRAHPIDRIAISRAGRRIARSLRRGWAPDPPLRTPASRTLSLTPGPSAGRRPVWRVDGRDLLVEAAVSVTLRDHGRPTRFAEGSIWSTLFALLFAETYFLPRPGVLPVPLLSGPLDLGTPAFRASRQGPVDAVLSAIDRGEAPDRVAAADAKWRGVRLAGAHWEIATTETLVAVARGMGPLGLRTVMEAFLTSGGRAFGGLPDLVVLPGPEVNVEGLFPARLSAGLHLVEVKGPGDTVRDEQAIWFDRLVAAGVSVELWRIQAL